MIVYVAEINSDDPSNFFILDLDKLPDKPEYGAYREAVLKAVASGEAETIDIDISFSYGNWCEDAIIEPPCTIDATVELYVG